MFDRKSVYALNKLDPEAIVCESATGVHIRLTREDFSSDEEFDYWKKWSDKGYQRIENAGQNDDRCLRLDAQCDVPAPSAEDVALVPYKAAEETRQRRQILDCFRIRLTEKQYRRLCLYYLDRKTETEIAALEGVAQQQISKSIRSGAKIVEKFFQKFFG